MHLPLQLARVDPIVASFCGGAVGAVSALLVVELNNVKKQQRNRWGGGRVFLCRLWFRLGLGWGGVWRASRLRARARVRLRFGCAPEAEAGRRGTPTNQPHALTPPRPPRARRCHYCEGTGYLPCGHCVGSGIDPATRCPCAYCAGTSKVMCTGCLCTGKTMATEHDPRFDPF
jgi:hypothetical protein